MKASVLRHAGAYGLAVVLGTLVGCGGNRDDLGTVTGTVRLDGEPLENAVVEFVPTGGGGSTAYGRTNARGEYELMFTTDTPGASIGENRVRISTADVRDEGGKEVVVPERVPARFNADTELVRTVEPGANLLDFDLESTGEVTQPELADQ